MYEVRNGKFVMIYMYHVLFLFPSKEHVGK